MPSELEFVQGDDACRGLARKGDHVNHELTGQDLQHCNVLGAQRNSQQTCICGSF